MVAQFIEAPFEMQKRLVIPEQVTQQCQAQGIPISGAATDDDDEGASAATASQD
jgi:hypothetical protein